MTSLRTERLLLRQWRDSDRDPWAAMNADPRVMEHFPGTLGREQSDEFVDRHRALIEDQGWGLWAVEVVGGAPFVGFTGLAVPGFAVPIREDGCVEIGWRLAAEHWGQGYAPEAARVVLDFAWAELDLHEVVSFTFVGNERSRRVMEKIGLEADGEFDHPRLPGHRIQRHVLYRAGNPGRGLTPGRGR